mmetsp:Transcript_22636/g.57888  ORF Transcript_22636/g.57888 Transcript_22636/m.57888 type:complete len:250 (-) Transcript_22636:321-1070(-)
MARRSATGASGRLGVHREHALQVGLQVRQDLGHEAAALAAQREVRSRDLLQVLPLHRLAPKHQLVHLAVEELQQLTKPLDDHFGQGLELSAELHVIVQELDQCEDRRHDQKVDPLHVQISLHALVGWVQLQAQLLAHELVEYSLVLRRHISPLPSLLFQGAVQLLSAELVKLLDDVLRLGVQDGPNRCSHIGSREGLLEVQPLSALVLQSSDLVQSVVAQFQKLPPIVRLQRFVLALPRLKKNAQFLQV